VLADEAIAAMQLEAGVDDTAADTTGRRTIA
jgi:hypothetical protein